MKKIPVYKSGIFFGGVRDFMKDPLKFPLEQTRQLGDFFRVRFFDRQLFVTTNLEVIRHVLQVNHRNYHKSPAYSQLRLALGKGLLTNEGDSWFQQRRLAQPAFYKKQLRELFGSMQEETDLYVDRLLQKADTEPEVDLSFEMMQLTATIVLRTLFSAGNDADQEEIYRLINNAQEYVMWRVNHPLQIPLTYINGRHRRFLNDKKVFDDLMFGLIEERLADPVAYPDLLNMLMQAKDADTGETMTRQQLRDESITVFAAGHETSANALTWTLYLLSQHPEKLATLRAEIQKTLGDRRPALEDLREMRYVASVIDESMRLYPPAYGLGRSALGQDEILGVKIPRRAVLFISIYALHRDPAYWEAPDEFRPERFLEPNPDRPRLAYMPFGAGPRICIGNNFALMEMQLILIRLLQHFDFQLVEGQTVELEPLITLRPKQGIRMKVSKRPTTVPH
jgi:cytochrome P450